MKITLNKLEISENFLDIVKSNKINIGEEIEAKIIKKNSVNNAILLIRGKRVVSEFINGVPKLDSLNLKLEKIDKGILTFSIINKTNKTEFLKQISEYIVQKEIDPLILNKLNLNYLLNNLTSIFDLNSLIFKSEIKNKTDYVKFFQKLLKLGISKEKLKFLSDIIIRSNNKFFPIYSILGFYFNKKNKNYLNESEISNKIEEIVVELDKLCKNDKDLIKNLIDLFIIDEFKSNLEYFEVPILLNDEEYSFKCLGDRNSIVISIEFSELGELELLISKQNSEINISIYSDNKEVVNKLEESIDLFNDYVEDNLKIMVKIFNKNLIINHIKETIKYYLLESELDFKV
jgi:hypothetical protein